MNTLLVVEDEKLIRQGIVADPAKQRAGGGDSGVSKRRRGIGDFEKTEGGRHVH